MERLKLTEESRKVLILAGVKFESWLLSRACADGKQPESVNPEDFNSLFLNLSPTEIAYFLKSIHTPVEMPTEERQAA